MGEIGLREIKLQI